MRKMYPSAIRVLLRDKNTFYGLLDIQHQSSGGEDSFFLRLPTHITGKKIYSSFDIDSQPRAGYHTFNIEKILVAHEDPYISYHGNSGAVHINAFPVGEHTKVPLMRDRHISTQQDLVKDGKVHQFANIIFPLDLSKLGEIKLPSPPFVYNYIEISDSPFMHNKTGQQGPLAFVIDKGFIQPSQALGLNFLLAPKGLKPEKSMIDEMPARVLDKGSFSGETSNLDLLVEIYEVENEGKNKNSDICVGVVFSDEGHYSFGVR